MTYQDTWAICTECGEKFVFRVEDQKRQARNGEDITPPKFCPNCRPGGPVSYGSTSSSPSSKPRSSESRSSSTPKTKPEDLGAGPHEGVVKWYDNDKGYGFVVHSEGHEIFFHRTGIATSETPNFADNTPVTYLIEQTEKGPEAIEVERLVDSD